MKITEEFIASVAADHVARNVDKAISEQLLYDLRFAMESERIERLLLEQSADTAEKWLQRDAVAMGTKQNEVMDKRDAD